MAGADILSLIDAAIDDWSTGPDAVRYNAPPRPASPPRTSSSPYSLTDARLVIGDHEVPAVNIRVEADWSRPRPLSLTMLGMAAEFERQMAALSQAERDEFVAYWQTSPWGFEQAWRNWCLRRTAESTRVTLTASLEQFTVAMARACESVMLLARSLRSCSARECFCHPAPFPAARDYRRRTRHRNRRR